jgi:hypothetical protein
MLLTLFFGDISPAHASLKEVMVYNKNILYINKFVNIVNIKDIINIDYNIKNKKLKAKTLYLINDLRIKNKFVMPDYSIRLNLNSKVDKRVFISRLANALKAVETGGAGAYTRKSYSSDASGAYQYMPGTWNNYLGYRKASDAPAWVQDQRISSELLVSYKKYHSWMKAVAAHLSPARANDMRTWNKPMPGNPTVQQYVNAVFKKANINPAC